MAKSAQEWLDALKSADRRESTFRKEGSRLFKMYNGEEDPPTAFNILYSNTETILPALFSASPVPMLARRKTARDHVLSFEASKLGTQILTYEIDSGDSESGDFYTEVESAVLDALICGRGIAYACHEYAEIEGGVAEASIHARHCQWDGFRHGYAKRWEDVPWVSFDEVMPLEEAKKKWPKVEFSFDSKDAEEERKVLREDPESSVKVICLHKIWDRSTRTVVTVSPQAREVILEEIPNPLDVEGFFPCPRPLYIVRKSNSLLPTAPFRLYENQAKELNRLTVRINKIVETLKVRGIYNAAVKELGQVMAAEDGVLIPAKNVEQLSAQNADIDRAIWLMPVEKIVMVLTQLYQARESCKAVIFEICGIADIMRGASKASETLGAQQIKNQWGTLRLKKLQTEVQRFVRDLLRVMLDASVRVIPPEVLAGISGGDLPFAALRDQARMQVQATAATGQAPDPEAMALAAGPALEEVLQLLQNDALRDFAVTIETNSTLGPEASEEQQQLTMAFGGIAQVINGLAPLIEKGAMPYDVAKTFLLAVAKKFPFGPEVETALRGLEAPEPQQDPGSKEAMAQKDLQIQQLQAQINAQAREMALQKREFDVQLREAQADVAEDLLKAHEKVTTSTLQAKEGVLKSRESTSQQLSKGAADSGKIVESFKGTVEGLQAFAQGLLQALGPLMQVAQVAQEGSQRTEQVLSSLAPTLQSLEQGQQGLLQALLTPKQVVRGPDGRISGVEPRLQ